MTNEEAILHMTLRREELKHSVSDLDEDIKAFDMAIEALEQTRWIPVSERLPKEHKEVIVTDIETSDTYISRYIGNGYWECDNGVFKNRIISWQPKPKPYKVEPQESEDKE